MKLAKGKTAARVEQEQTERTEKKTKFFSPLFPLFPPVGQSLSGLRLPFSVLLCALAAGFLLTLACLASQPAPLTLIVTTVTNTVPVVLGTNTLHFKSVMFQGLKAAHTTNTGTVWIQFSSTNDAGGFKLPAGGSVLVTSTRALDAADFWIDSETSGDGVVAMIYDVQP